MTHEELRPFLDRAVAVRVAGSEAVTGVLKRPDPAAPERYAVISRDGESDPVLIEASEIEGIEA